MTGRISPKGKTGKRPRAADSIAPDGPASPARMIDETQRLINILFGIEDGTPSKSGPKSTADRRGNQGEETVVIDETQRLINKLFGIDDETYLKYREAQQDEEAVANKGGNAPLDEAQRKVNALCGVDETTFKKCDRRGSRKR